MQAVLYINHGTRLQQGIAEARSFIQRTKEYVEAPIQEICFLELASPTIQEGIDSCVKQGATQIAVIPILLLTAVHAKQDIPFQLVAIKKQYPHIPISFGQPFGVDARMATCLYDKVMDLDVAIDANSLILIVGRGSSDPEVKTDLQAIARIFQQTYEFPHVTTCFLYGASPHVDEALHHAIQTGFKQIVIVPYLLFSGLLMKSLRKKIADLQVAGASVHLCETLGDHHLVRDVLVDRVQERLGGTRMGESQWIYTQ